MLSWFIHHLSIENHSGTQRLSLTFTAWPRDLNPHRSSGVQVWNRDGMFATKILTAPGWPPRIDLAITVLSSLQAQVVSSDRKVD